MKMKYDGVFYESNSGVGKSIQMFENATKTKINAMRLTHNLLVDWVHRQKKNTYTTESSSFTEKIMNRNKLIH